MAGWDIISSGRGKVIQPEEYESQKQLHV